ncbi:hypothetical protein PGTUg99_013234 [Puccinia graminis f. sp. tritici]|uniref:Uncharacterized protein n=1 Tax=Puccinia graminis f. sp. tritici TaxID=56615 RepID=A0A5B0QZ11_PUCGR|nr:hypothetical protein PGTUg99_013234 [Puccinia graminis f. sp. tritici]
MSGFGIDLFERENPPLGMGYHSATENCHIHTIGPQPEKPTLIGRAKPADLSD